MLLITFYGIRKYAFVIVWECVEISKSFIIQYNVNKKIEYCKKLRKFRKTFLPGQLYIYKDEIWQKFRIFDFLPYYCVLSGFSVFFVYFWYSGATF